MKRYTLAILASHPIQYQAPWFRALAEDVDLTVFFAHRQTAAGQAAAGFGTPFDWDVDIVSGFRSVFLHNVSKRPGTDAYSGCDTPGIGKVIAGYRPDAFIALGWYLKSYVQAIVACRRFDVPVMVRSDSQLGTRRTPLRRVAKEFLFRLLFRQLDACLAVGTRSAAYFRHYGVSADRLFIVPHSVDETRFTPGALDSSGKRQAVRRDLKIANLDIVLLFVGKLVPRKRPLDLIGGLKYLQDSGLRVRALYAGDGESREAILGFANDLGVRADVLGFVNQSQLPDIYRAADILVLPSDATETWGLVVNEAMRCGLPAVVSEDVGCAPDLVEPGVTGERYRCGDRAGLAAGVAALVPRLGTDGLSRALNERMAEWSVGAAVRGTIAALDSVTA